jgi:hypothetical protein
MGEANLTRVPSVGRIVHFFQNSDPLVASAAIVVKVHTPQRVNLKVFLDSTQPDLYVNDVQQGQGPGMWDWPKQV